MKVSFFSTALYLLLSLNLYGQGMSIQTINAGGGSESFFLEDLNIEWSVGEVFATLYLANNYTFSEGFQQFHITDGLTSAHQTMSYQINVFPNPFSDQIDIRLPEGMQSSPELTVDLYTSSGSRIFMDIALHEQQTLNTSLLGPGLYFLSVKDDHGLLQVEKLIKLR